MVNGPIAHGQLVNDLMVNGQMAKGLLVNGLMVQLLTTKWLKVQWWLVSGVADLGACGIGEAVWAVLFGREEEGAEVVRKTGRRGNRLPALLDHRRLYRRSQRLLLGRLSRRVRRKRRRRRKRRSRRKCNWSVTWLQVTLPADIPPPSLCKRILQGHKRCDIIHRIIVLVT